MYMQVGAYQCVQMVLFPGTQKFCTDSGDKNECFSISWLLNRAEDFWYVKAVVLFCL